MAKTIEAITKKDIVDKLRKIGLKQGDHIIVHSSLSSFGKVIGGADSVIDALIEAVRKEGTVIVPTFGDNPEAFNPNKSETNLGLIPKIFWRRKAAVRSLHPLASVAAIGKKADWFVEGHNNAKLAHGSNSPYHKLYELGGKVLLLGVDQDRNTFLHTVEEIFHLSYLKPKKASYIDKSGKVKTKTWQYFPGPHRNFIGLQNWLEENGFTKKTRIGNCVAQLMPCRQLLDALLRRVEQKPNLFISENPNLPDGLRQNADILRSILKKEHFTLAADSQYAGQYLEECIDNLNRFGIDEIVLSYINDVAWSRLKESKRKWYLKGLLSAGIKIAAIKLPVLEPDITIQLLKEAKIRTIIIPSTSLKEDIDKIACAEFDVLIENTRTSSSNYVGQIEKHANRKNRVKAAFNPLEFVRVGEGPFLETYSKTRIKKYIDLMFINDGLATGERTALEEGLAEIKELISILRSRSFSGTFVLQSMSPQSFKKTATKFLDILNELGKAV